MRYGLDDNILNSINEVFKKYGDIKKVILFGSRAKGSHKKGSDVDIAIVSKGMDLKTLHKIENEIDDMMMPYIFDIKIYHNIKNSNLLEHINRIGKTIYKKDRVE